MSTNPTELITAARAAEILDLTLAALCFRRKKGSSPPWTDIAPPGHKRPQVRYQLSDILAFRDERHIPEGQPIPSRAELAERLAVVEKALAKLKRRPRNKRRAFPGLSV